MTTAIINDVHVCYPSLRKSPKRPGLEKVIRQDAHRRLREDVEPAARVEGLLAEEMEDLGGER